MTARFKGTLTKTKSAKAKVVKKVKKIKEGRPTVLDDQVKATLGKMWNRWEGRLEVKKRCRVHVKVGTYLNGKDKMLFKFKCESCQQVNEELDVDHIEPVVDPDVGFVDLDTWVTRKFVPADKLQGLCKKCHKIKTSTEAAVRATTRKSKKVAIEEELKNIFEGD